MLNAKDLELLAAKGISEKQIEEQLACFVKGFPFLEITASASVERGIMVIPQEKQATYMDAWDAYLAKNKKIVKFVPASGAASRMFKNLYEFLSADYNEPQNAFEKKFFDDIRKFAFYDALNRACIENEAKDIPALIALGQYKAVVSNLLESKGLNYGQLPKGLLLFHSYPQTARTAMEEHLAEGAMYAKNNAGEVNIHFTVSPEHKALFEQRLMFGRHSEMYIHFAGIVLRIHRTFGQMFFHRRTGCLRIRMKKQQTFRKLSVVQSFRLQQVGDNSLILSESD